MTTPKLREGARIAMEDIDLNKLVADLAAEHGIDDSVAVVNFKKAIAVIIAEAIGYYINRGRDEATPKN